VGFEFIGLGEMLCFLKIYWMSAELLSAVELHGHGHM
jgi:hypothetical protein